MTSIGWDRVWSQTVQSDQEIRSVACQLTWSFVIASRQAPWGAGVVMTMILLIVIDMKILKMGRTLYSLKNGSFLVEWQQNYYWSVEYCLDEKFFPDCGESDERLVYLLGAYLEPLPCLRLCAPPPPPLWNSQSRALSSRLLHRHPSPAVGRPRADWRILWRPTRPRFSPGAGPSQIGTYERYPVRIFVYEHLRIYLRLAYFSSFTLTVEARTSAIVSVERLPGSVSQWRRLPGRVRYGATSVKDGRTRMWQLGALPAGKMCLKTRY